VWGELYGEGWGNGVDSELDGVCMISYESAAKGLVMDGEDVSIDGDESDHWRREGGKLE
jgi:hypothetical protein